MAPKPKKPDPPPPAPDVDQRSYIGCPTPLSPPPWRSSLIWCANPRQTSPQPPWWIDCHNKQKNSGRAGVGGASPSTSLTRNKSSRNGHDGVLPAWSAISISGWSSRIGSPLSGLGEKRSWLPIYFVLSRSAHRPSSLWYNFQIHLSIRAIFIDWCWGYQVPKLPRPTHHGPVHHVVSTFISRPPLPKISGILTYSSPYV
jgi:hypothetical protein